MSAPGRAAAALACALLLAAAGARAQADDSGAPREPPPEAPPGDWSAERPESVAAGEVAATFTATGSATSRPRTSQRLRFRGDGGDGTLRTGADPLAGGRVATPLGGGALRVGGLAPLWGEGLVLGATAQPWQVVPDDRGGRAELAGHTGDGARWRGSGPWRPELLAGRFARRTLAGARAGRGALALGVLGGDGGAQASAAWRTPGAGAELALDARGRWRAGFSVRRTGAAGALTLRARGGLPALRPLAEPARAGPARLLAVAAEHAAGALRARAHAALWRFAPGVAGAAAQLEVRRPLGDHATVDLGFDEQHGTRRDPALATASGTAAGMRQGGWCEWRGRAGGRELTLRHELTGQRAFARQAVRRALTARATSPLPLGATLAVTHSAWVTQGGEMLWLAESDDGVLTLRAASGPGERTRAELVLPLRGGRARASGEWNTVRAQRPAPRWTLEWTCRMRA